MRIVQYIDKNDISISDKFTQGYDEARCVEALYILYDFLREFMKTEDASCLYSIGILGIFEADFSSAVVDYHAKDTKARAWFSNPKSLFALEKYGFVISEIKVIDENKPKNKWTGKDVLQFRIAYPQNNDLLLGLKLFTTVCGKMGGIPFYKADIRIMYKNAPKHYAPPLNEVYEFLTEKEAELVGMFNTKLEEIGCARNLERDYMTKYIHPKNKGKTFATIYTIERNGKNEIELKLNLRNIGKYTDCLNNCIKTVITSILTTEECHNCKTACGGVFFEYDCKRYKKCPWHIFRFNNFTEQAIQNYIQLIELEDKELRA